ncbi:DUF6086 family protein [Actinoplanes sp. NPDC048967]|uniref:DUF6086 family protein n=1 Tax=Actinoplanes sp. NPDC048967 TaxID=3155269 RepID=UPI0033C3DD78
MSYIFDADDRVVWSPASQVGKTYVGLADALSDAISVPHGLSPMASDYYEIGSSQFRTFVEALNSEYSIGHRVAQGLIRGFVLTSLVLLDRMNNGMREQLDASTVAAMTELSSAMPEL